MKNQNIRTVIVIGFFLLAVACQAETSTSGTTTTATSNAGPAEQTVGQTTVVQEESTTVPEETGTPAVLVTPAVPATPVETAAPTETPVAENTPDMRRQALYGSLPAYLMNGDFETLETLMDEWFAIIYWGAEGQTLTREDAMQELRDNLLLDPSAIRFTLEKSLFPDLGGVDPTKVFGYKVKVVDMVYTGGWGADGQGEALLAIGLNPNGQYWAGMIYASEGFEDASSQEGTVTYVNEHAGYAFDYPAGWIVQGEPRQHGYNYVIILKSFKLSQGPGPVSEDQVKLDFVTCNSVECNTLQAMEERLDEDVAAGMLEILSEEEWTLDSGIPAIRRRVVGPMGIESALLFTEINGQSLSVSGFGDLSAFDEIVRTLRPAGSQAAGGGLRARLEIPHTLPLGEPVKVQFHLVNDSNEDLYVLNWFTPLEGIGGEIFHVKRDGEIVPYQGILASRDDPTPDSYVLLGPAEVAWAEVDLSEAYDFSIPGTYTIEFISPRTSHVARSQAGMARSLGELGPVEIPSNEVMVAIGAADDS